MTVGAASVLNFGPFSLRFLVIMPQTSYLEA